MIPIIDILSLGCIALSARKGKRRGPSREIYRLLRLGIALVAGCGLYSLTHGLLVDLLPAASGLAGFLIYFVGAFALVRMAKKVLIRKLDHRFQDGNADRAGLVAGALRGFLLVMCLMTSAHIAPLFPLKASITQNSWFGRIPQLYLPKDKNLPDEDGG